MMKIYCICLLITANLFAQISENSINCATYKVGFNSNNDKSTSKPNAIPNPEAQKRFQDKIAAMEQIECKLYFTTEKSIYSIVNKMNATNSIADRLAKIPFSGLFFKDIITKEKIKQTTFGGVNNIILPYDEYNWVITGESKLISGYKCFKATCEYQFLNRKKEYDTRHAEAWFAPEIAVPFGPRGFDGLPGLVLEVFYDGIIYFHAVKIEFDLNDSNVKVEKPIKGNNLTLAEYDDMQKKMMDKRQQN